MWEFRLQARGLHPSVTMTAGNNDTSHAHALPALTLNLGQAHASTQVLDPCVRLGLDSATSNALVNSALLTDLKRTTGSNASYSSQALPCTCWLSPFSPRIAKSAIYLHKGCNTSVISRLVVGPLTPQLLSVAKQGRWTDKQFVRLVTVDNPPHSLQAHNTMQAIDRIPKSSSYLSSDVRLAPVQPSLCAATHLPIRCVFPHKCCCSSQSKLQPP